jgi:hypothetical protein
MSHRFWDSVCRCVIMIKFCCVIMHKYRRIIMNHSIPHNATLYTVMSYMRLRDTSAEATIREDLLRIGTVKRANPRRRSSREMLDLTALHQSYTTMTKKEFPYRLIIGLLRHS